MYERSFPVKTYRLKKRDTIRQPWMTTALLRSCKTKSRLYKTYIKSPSEVNRRKFVTYRNIFKRIRKAAERQYYATRLVECENNLHETWRIIKTLLHGCGSTALPDSIYIGDIESKDKNLIANKFNEYFTELGPKLAANVIPTGTSFNDYLKNPIPSSIGIELTSPDEIVSIAKGLRTTHSEGTDGIDPKIAKHSIETIKSPLAAIINCSLTTGVIPYSLKTAKVVPIFKSGDRQHISNYRPISVLPYFSKFFEKVMHERIMSYITAKNILYNGQFGFRKGLSTHMAVLEMCDKITEARDNNQFSIGVFLDLSKAFDTVDHDILLKKTIPLWNKGYVLGLAQGLPNTQKTMRLL